LITLSLFVLRKQSILFARVFTTWLNHNPHYSMPFYFHRRYYEIIPYQSIKIYENIGVYRGWNNKHINQHYVVHLNCTNTYQSVELDTISY